MQDWRRAVGVLVPQAEAIGMVGVIRSLGRAGYCVHAMAGNPTAIGLRSNMAGTAVVSPASGVDGYTDWVLRYIDDNDIRVIIPSEGFLVATRPIFDELAPLMPIPNDAAVVRRCFSKAETTQYFLSVEDSRFRRYLPPSLVVWQDETLPTSDELAALGSRLYIKTDAVLASGMNDGGVYPADTPDAALDIIREKLETYRGVLVQGGVSGRKATVNLCLRDGRLLAESMCLATHENPHSGGLTVLRHTWWNDGMRDDALARLVELGWDGVAMMEYKWHADKEAFYFIEANTRYWNALHLDLFAGTDFPKIQVDAFLGAKVDAVDRQPLGVTCRYTVPGEVGHVLSRIRDSSVSLPARLWTGFEFFWLFLNPWVRTDLYFPGDRRLYWSRWKRFFIDLFRRNAA